MEIQRTAKSCKIKKKENFAGIIQRVDFSTLIPTIRNGKYDLIRVGKNRLNISFKIKNIQLVEEKFFVEKHVFI